MRDSQQKGQNVEEEQFAPHRQLGGHRRGDHGALPRRDRVIEIGAVAGKGGRIIEEFHRLIDPGRPVPRQAQRIHHISDAMLRGQPPAREVFPELHRFLGASLLVAHNARFDLAFLRSELARLGLGLSNPHRCTLQLSRRAWPQLPNHRLETVAGTCSAKRAAGEGLHRALADARLTARVWLALNA